MPTRHIRIKILNKIWYVKWSSKAAAWYVWADAKVGKQGLLRIVLLWLFYISFSWTFSPLYSENRGEQTRVNCE